MLQSKDIEWLHGYENNTHIYTAYKRLTSDPETHRLKVTGWKKVFYANGNEKKAMVVILTLDKIDFITKTATTNKEGYYIMIMG